LKEADALAAEIEQIQLKYKSMNIDTAAEAGNKLNNFLEEHRTKLEKAISSVSSGMHLPASWLCDTEKALVHLRLSDSVARFGRASSANDQVFRLKRVGIELEGKQQIRQADTSLASIFAHPDYKRNVVSQFVSNARLLRLSGFIFFFNEIASYLTLSSFLFFSPPFFYFFFFLVWIKELDCLYELMCFQIDYYDNLRLAHRGKIDDEYGSCPLLGRGCVHSTLES
jgi:hypothetical protein